MRPADPRPAADRSIAPCPPSHLARPADTISFMSGRVAASNLPRECRESLADALCRVIGPAAGETEYARVIAVLGLGTLVTASTVEPPAAWPYVARDAALMESSRLLGMRVRELHPPAAAAGLRDSAEFGLHFLDSYVPLIEKALAVGQSVLAWRGWPPPYENSWGVIESCAAAGVAGRCANAQAGAVAMVGPAHQVYVVEARDAPQPLASDELLAHVASLAIRQFDGAWTTDGVTLTSVAALNAWSAAIEASRPCAAAGSRPLMDHAAVQNYCNIFRSAHVVLLNWLATCAQSMPAAPRIQLVAQWLDSLRRQVRILDELNPMLLDQSPSSSEQSRGALQSALRRFADIEQALAAPLRTLAAKRSAAGP